MGVQEPEEYEAISQIQEHPRVAVIPDDNGA